MKRIFSFTLLLVALSLLTGCSLFFDNLHTCDFSPWEVAVEPTCHRVGTEERFCIECGETEFRDIDRLSHTPVDCPAKKETCTEEGNTAGTYCSVCRQIISGIDKIPATGHTVVIDPAVEPEDNLPGRTEGSHCSVCGEVIKKQTSVFASDYSNTLKYHGDYAYESLFELENGEAMAELYLEMESACAEFHNSLSDAKSKEVNNNDVYYAAEIVFSDNGLTPEEAVSVWSAFLTDHPIYYWTSKVVTYSSDFISINVDEEYRLGSEREKINLSIYEATEDLISSVSDESSIYQITLAFHDMIIHRANYAYEDDGVTPSDDGYAHNILGTLLYGRGVCESYAKTFQLLLNYCNIENVYVTGYSGQPHAWNLVKLDNGKWYWYDLTFDDQPDWLLGIRHNYFCVTDDTLVNWNDGSLDRNQSFVDGHIPSEYGGLGTDYFYRLPKRADSFFDNDELILRDDIIEADGLEFVLIGYRTLALTRINREGMVSIPESLSIDGKDYVVSFIGKYDEENKVIVSGSVIYYDSLTRDHVNVTGIYIPKTVEYIFDYAFDHCYTIESFTVDPENSVFESVDGVLFTESLYTLIKYPLAKDGANYTVPNKTVHIAFGAFGDGGNVFCPENLTSLVFPSSVKHIGVFSGGIGFHDADPESLSEIIVISGYIERLYLMLGSGVRFN